MRWLKRQSNRPSNYTYIIASVVSSHHLLAIFGKIALHEMELESERSILLHEVERLATHLLMIL